VLHCTFAAAGFAASSTRIWRIRSKYRFNTLLIEISTTQQTEMDLGLRIAIGMGVAAGTAGLIIVPNREAKRCRSNGHVRHEV